MRESRADPRAEQQPQGQKECGGDIQMSSFVVLPCAQCADGKEEGGERSASGSDGTETRQQNESRNYDESAANPEQPRQNSRAKPDCNKDQGHGCSLQVELLQSSEKLSLKTSAARKALARLVVEERHVPPHRGAATAKWSR